MPMEVDQPSSSPEDSFPYMIDLVEYRRPEISDWIEKEAVAFWDSLDETSIMHIKF